MSQILLNDLTLLTIMSSDKLMNVSKVGEFLIIFLLLKMLSIAEDLCKQQMRLLLIDIGPWVRVTPTLHELYAHLPQLIEENGSRGLKALSEENLEALHKILRRIRERKSRLMNVGSNLTDCITRYACESWSGFVIMG